MCAAPIFGSDSESVQLAAEFLVYDTERELDLARGELVGEFGEGLPAGVIDVVDRRAVEDQPARRVIDLDQAEHLLGEPGGVRVEDAPTEAVDDEPG